MIVGDKGATGVLLAPSNCSARRYLHRRTLKQDGEVHRYWCLARSVRDGRRVIRQTMAQLGGSGTALDPLKCGSS